MAGVNYVYDLNYSDFISITIGVEVKYSPIYTNTYKSSITKYKCKCDLLNRVLITNTTI